MKKHLAVITICTLALANAVPAMPVYAASKKPAAAYSAKQRREGQKKIKDAASRIKSAFKKQDLNALADLCSFPLIISYASGELTELKSKSELLALGPVRFTEGMKSAIASTDVSKLKEVGNAGVQMGGDAGLSCLNLEENGRSTTYIVITTARLAVIQGPSKLETWKKQPLQSRNAFRTEILKLFPGFAVIR